MFPLTRAYVVYHKAAADVKKKSAMGCLLHSLSTTGYIHDVGEEHNNRCLDCILRLAKGMPATYVERAVSVFWVRWDSNPRLIG